MGSISTLILLDIDDVRGRVLPAVRAWVAGGEPADWWAEALRQAGERGPDPADRAAWAAILWPEPADVSDAGGSRLIPLPGRDLGEDTRSAVEVAMITATVGDGLAFGNSSWLSLDLLDEFDSVLAPAPDPGSRIAAMLDRFDNGLRHVQSGTGGYGEGLRGALDAAEVAELDDELTARASAPASGSVDDLRDAMDAIGADFEHVRQMRTTLLALHSMAHRARRHRSGLLHGRDLALRGLGQWHHGVFHRHPSTDPGH
ncbi:MAG: hypothetical protein V7637_6082 [Mycobacteriales bacterium]